MTFLELKENDELIHNKTYYVYCGLSKYATEGIENALFKVFKITSKFITLKLVHPKWKRNFIIPSRFFDDDISKHELRKEK